MNGKNVIFIAHRINTIKELQKIPHQYGVEVDLRDRGDRLILQHEPFLDGEDFEKYLKFYRHGTMILNIKSEQIELKVLDLLKKYRIRDYFFLDSSFGMIYLLTKEGEKNIAIRFSEFESIETVLAMEGKVQWVWCDCFTKLAIDQKDFKRLKEGGFKLCLASPELLGRPHDIASYKNYLARQGMELDAICTKTRNIKEWLNNKSPAVRSFS